MNNKIIVYQIFTRLYGNRNTSRKENGSIEENGCGKLNDLTPTVLKKIRNMGVSHVWYTGVIRHATQTDYSDHGIPVNHPAVVKGKAGSPYAITDYYDIDPDLATDVDLRMLEFEQLFISPDPSNPMMTKSLVARYYTLAAANILKGWVLGDFQEHSADEMVETFLFLLNHSLTDYVPSAKR